jgi:hypothetical protein
MRILFVPGPILLTDLDAWVKPDCKRFVRPQKKDPVGMP